MSDDAAIPTVGHLLTEQINAATSDIDCRTPLEIIQIFCDEDAGVATAVALEKPHIARAIASIAERMRQGGRIIYMGAGTSGRLGALDAYECPPTFNIAPDRVIGLIAGGHFALDQAMEDFEDNAAAGRDDVRALNISVNDVIIGISASGRTPYVIGGIAYARSCRALTVGIACNTPSELADLVDIMIAPVVGPEVISGSTRLKAGTAQKMVLNMISTGTMILLGKTYGNLMVDVQASNDKLRLRARNVVQRIANCDAAIAEEYLQRADGNTRLAITMLHFNENAVAAQNRLLAHGGNLRAALRSAT